MPPASNRDREEPYKGARGVRGVLRGYLTLLGFLAPLKFGTTVISSEIPFFPLSLFEWFLIPWPPWLMPVLAGAGLAASSLTVRRIPGRTAEWLFPAVWGLLPLTAAIGLIRTTELDVAQRFLWHLTGAAAFGLAVFVAAKNDRILHRWLLAAIVAGTLCVALSGWRQALGGLEETQRLALQQAQEEGIYHSKGMLSRLKQRRAYGPFVYPNSFAAHLVLTLPLVIATLWRWGGRVEPVRVSRPLFALAAALLTGGALIFSGSRAAMLALSGGIAFAALMLPALRKWRPFIVAGALLGGLLLLLAVNRGRSLSSAAARLDYYRAAVNMTVSHPVTGVGLGEFFPHYMRLKTADAEETRVPHNFILNLLSQAGIAAGAAVLVCYLVPLFARALIRHGSGRSPPLLETAVIQAGLAAWLLHALLDFNIMIPGTVQTVVVLPMLLMHGEPAVEPPAGKFQRDWKRRGLLLGVALFATAGIWRWPGERAYQRFYNNTRSGEVSTATLREQAARAAGLLPLSPYPWTVFGRVAEQRFRHGLAMKAYRRAAARAPHRASLHAKVARSAWKVGRHQEARQALRRALQWYPANPEFRDMAKVMGIRLPTAPPER